jgi:parallel beta-helix repeat protein
VTNVFYIANSIFWNSQGGPPSAYTLLDNNAATVYVNANYSVLHALYDENQTLVPIYAQVDADPKWIAPASGSYDLGPSSPAIDAGFAQSNLGLPSNDMIGQARLIGPNPDLGALESNGSTLPTYIVGNTNNDGAGSLRQAMLDANGSGKALVEIIFQLPGGCPQVIALNTPLPDITTGMRIEGYSQAGSVPNGDPNFFDATLCVLIKPASGTLNTAFKVPATALNGQLTLNGVGLGGFGTPISLSAGPVHKITGIQIGGNVLGVDLPGPGLNGIFVSLTGAGGVIIGGDTPAEMNVIGGAASNGIDIGAGSKANPDLCQVVGNLIGVSQNGSTRLPNDWGINLAGSNCRVRNNRVAGNYYDQIWLNGGSNNVVQGNQIGYALDDTGWLNSSAGVLITGGSGNVVGAPYNQTITAGSVLANTIRYAGKGGVIVKYPGAAGNAIRGNSIRDVGGLAIDLNDDGATPNDAVDADTGPNLLKNFATVTSIQFKNAIPPVGALNVQAYVFGELTGNVANLNRVDAYFYNGSCVAGGRGQAQYYLGSYLAFTFANGSPSAFNYLMNLPNFNGDGAIAFTATDQSGNTSELGTCFNVQQATLIDKLFKDSYE